MTKQQADPMTWADVWDLDDIAAALRLKATSARNMIVTRPEFPAPRKIAGNVRLWDAGDIKAWIAEHRKP